MLSFSLQRAKKCQDNIEIFTLSLTTQADTKGGRMIVYLLYPQSHPDMKLSNENKVRCFTKLKPELQTQIDFRALLINGVVGALLNKQH